MMSGQLNEDHGIILPIVLILALVLMITGLVFVSLGVQENRLVRREIIKRQAFYLAESGVEHTRVKLGQDWEGWQTYNPINATLEAGTYTTTIFDTNSSGVLLSEYDTKRRITSMGTMGEISKTVEVILRRLPIGSGGITKAITAGGNVTVSGSATINGDVEQNATCFEDPDAYFAEIFGVSKAEMKDIAQSSPNIYYDSAINNDIVENITWVDGTPDQSQIQGNWTRSGLLIVDGDLKITGGIIFNGIIWVTGSLEVSAGTPEINGAIFVESSTTVDITGNLTLSHHASTIDGTLGNLGIGVIIESWKEL